MPLSDFAGAVPRLAIVVPMYNEVVGAETCVRHLAAILPTLEVPALLIVVDDGSKDGTSAKLDELRLHVDFCVVHQPNAGYGGALMRGAREAATLDCDYVLFMDSDLTNPPEHIPRFVAAIRRGPDVVKGCRLRPPGDMRAVPWRRRIFTIVANFVARICFRMGLADCTNGFRAIRVRPFMEMPLTERGFAIIMEELYWAKRRGLSVVAVPTSLSSRKSDQRATAFSYRPSTLWSYLKHALRAALLSYRPRPASTR